MASILSGVQVSLNGLGQVRDAKRIHFVRLGVPDRAGLVFSPNVSRLFIAH